MAFKMKGFSGFKNVADTGYAGSSAFQDHKKGHAKTKEQLISEGFNPADADRMIKDGGTTGLYIPREVPYNKREGKAKKKGKKRPIDQAIKVAIPKPSAKPITIKAETTGKMQQADFEPAYEGADYSKDEIKKMSEKEKIAQIDGYSKKKIKAKKSTTSAHGQLSDAQYEYEQDKKILAKEKK